MTKFRFRYHFIFFCVGLGSTASSYGGITFTDLYKVGRPSGFQQLYMKPVGDGAMVGYGNLTTPGGHALYWSNQGIEVDLNPTGLSASTSLHAIGNQQVGYDNGTSTSNNAHAVAGNYIDLGSLLPSFFVSSSASYISGNTVFGAALDSSGISHAIAWDISAVPEPSTHFVVSLAMALFTKRHRRNYQLTGSYF